MSSSTTTSRIRSVGTAATTDLITSMYTVASSTATASPTTLAVAMPESTSSSHPLRKSVILRASIGGGTFLLVIVLALLVWYRRCHRMRAHLKSSVHPCSYPARPPTSIQPPHKGRSCGSRPGQSSSRQNALNDAPDAAAQTHNPVAHPVATAPVDPDPEKGHPDLSASTSYDHASRPSLRGPFISPPLLPETSGVPHAHEDGINPDLGDQDGRNGISETRINADIALSEAQCAIRSLGSQVQIPEYQSPTRA